MRSEHALELANTGASSRGPAVEHREEAIDRGLMSVRRGKDAKDLSVRRAHGRVPDRRTVGIRRRHGQKAEVRMLERRTLVSVESLAKSI